MVNNIGDTLGITDPMCGIDNWKRIYKLNLEDHVEMIELFVANMVAAGWERIVNITAGAAPENSGTVPYCSTNAAYTAYS